MSAARSSLLFCLGLAFATLAGVSAIRALLDSAEIETEVVTRHAVASYYRDRVAAYRSHGGRSDDHRVAFLGDSMVVSYPQSHQIAAVLQRQVRRLQTGGPRIRLINLGLAGTGVFDYYFMADVIAKLEARLVVIEFNLASTSSDFQRAFSRPELAGWLAGARILESAWLPTSWIGLTFDRLLLYAAIVRSGGFESWVTLNADQVRFDRARSMLEDQLALRDAKGLTPEAAHRKRRGFWLLARNDFPGANRHSAVATRSNLGTSLDGLRHDDPSLVMLAATVRTFRRQGSEVLVYANPINREHIARLGLLDESGLARSLRNIRSAVTRHGGHFVDLHRIFPDEAFRDRAGHFAYEGEINGPAELAARLAPLVLDLVAAPPRGGS